jgi:hypothetical protein
MTLNKEDQVVVLYALYRCGGKGRKSCIIYYIIENNLLRPRKGDNALRQNSETALENDLAWAREDLKRRKYLTMPEHGFWEITDSGREALFRIAKTIYEKNPNENWFERCNDIFIAEMSGLGKKLIENVKPA